MKRQVFQTALGYNFDFSNWGGLTWGTYGKKSKPKPADPCESACNPRTGSDAACAACQARGLYRPVQTFTSLYGQQCRDAMGFVFVGGGDNIQNFNTQEGCIARGGQVITDCCPKTGKCKFKCRDISGEFLITNTHF